MKRHVLARALVAPGLLGGLLACGIGGCSSSSGNGGGGDDGGTTADSSVPPDGATSDTGAATDAMTQADSGSTAPESGVISQDDSGTTADSGSSMGADSGGDAGNGAGDAAGDAPGTSDAAEAGPALTFCQTQSGLNFCADFDEPGALSPDAGALAWTSIVGSSAEVALSTAQAASPPDSLLVQLQNGPASPDQSAKVVEMITPASGVAQAIYQFDMYIATVPLANVGGFATDFQFLDTAGGTDQFGFRIGVFANTSGFDHADLEHNHPTLGGSDDIVNSIPITAGAWNHVEMVVAYSQASDGGNEVAFQLYINNSTTPAVDSTFPAPFAKAAFARFAAGMVYAFDSTNKDWGIYYDNFTLKLQ